MGVKLYRTNEIRGLKTGLKKILLFFYIISIDNNFANK